jgi:hypothetical protein
MITQERLKQLFIYEDDGRLRRIKGGKKQYPGCANGKYKHVQIVVDRKHYYAHRLVWLWFNGYMPSMIDHINGIANDNRIENLRECTKSQNSINSKLHSSNTSGYRGVSYFGRGRNKPWIAAITYNGKDLKLGYYFTAQEAAEAYQQKAKDLFNEFVR